MEGAGGEETRAPRPPARLALAAAAVVLVSVAAVLGIGRVVGDRLASDEPSEATVPVTGTQATTTTAPEGVVLAPPVSIDSTTTAPGG
ncbi:MAG: hypothetical protein ACTHN0_04685 [Aquihabitans sp.]